MLLATTKMKNNVHAISTPFNTRFAIRLSSSVFVASPTNHMSKPKKSVNPTLIITVFSKPQCSHCHNVIGLVSIPPILNNVTVETTSDSTRISNET